MKREDAVLLAKDLTQRILSTHQSLSENKYESGPVSPGDPPRWDGDPLSRRRRYDGKDFFFTRSNRKNSAVDRLHIPHRFTPATHRVAFFDTLFIELKPHGWQMIRPTVEGSTREGSIIFIKPEPTV